LIHIPELSRGLFNANEIDKIKTGINDYKKILEMAYEVDDGMGRKSRMFVAFLEMF
jgi:hypothetical protein